MKKEVKKNETEELVNLLNRIRVLLFLILIVLVINVVVNVTNTSNTWYLRGDTPTNGSENNEQEELPEYDVSKFEEVDYSGFKKAIKSKDISVVYMGRSTCGYCALFIPVMNEAQEKYGFKTYYLDVTRVFNFETNSVVDQKAFDEITGMNDFFKENFLATPMVAIFKNGKYVDGTIGYQELETYSSFLEKNGIKK